MDTTTQPRRKLSLADKIKILFGGMRVQGGALLFWFLVPVFIIFFLNSDAIYWARFDGAWMQTTGVVTNKVKNTGGVTERHDDPYKFTFSYTVDGQPYSSYSVSRLYFDIMEGDQVTVQYKAGDPTRARIMGMSEEGGSILLLLMLFGLIILVGIAYIGGIYKNGQLLYLLKHGQTTYGKRVGGRKLLLSYTRKGKEITIYSFDFDFEVDGKEYKAKASTSHPAQLEQEEQSLILYHSKKPSLNIVYKYNQILEGLEEKGSAVKKILSTVLGAALTIGLVYLVWRLQQ